MTDTKQPTEGRVVVPVDPAVAASVDRNLAAAGLTTLTATTPAGTRMRIGP